MTFGEKVRAAREVEGVGPRAVAGRWRETGPLAGRSVRISRLPRVWVRGTGPRMTELGWWVQVCSRNRVESLLGRLGDLAA